MVEKRALWEILGDSHGGGRDTAIDVKVILGWVEGVECGGGD